MEDKDFMQMKIDEFRNQRLELDEIARIELIFLKEFIVKLMTFFDESKEEKVYFTRKMVTSEECNYDLRREMCNELISDILHKGYKYISKESTSSQLVFEKIAYSICE